MAEDIQGGYFRWNCPGKRELREQILHQMDGRTSYVSDKDVYREIDKAILRSSHGGYGTLSEKEELRRQMFYSIRGFVFLKNIWVTAV